MKVDIKSVNRILTCVKYLTVLHLEIKSKSLELYRNLILFLNQSYDQLATLGDVKSYRHVILIETKVKITFEFGSENVDDFFGCIKISYAVINI